jgi:hypothetical protein
MTTTRNVYGDHLASLLKFCGDFAEVINVPGEPKFQPVYLDAYEDYESLPSGSLIGVAGYTVEVDEHLPRVILMIGLATENDVNEFRLTAAMGKLMTRLLPTKIIPVWDALTGDVLGRMTIQNGVRTMPSSGALGRSVKYIAFTAASDVTVDLSA